MRRTTTDRCPAHIARDLLAHVDDAFVSMPQQYDVGLRSRVRTNGIGAETGQHASRREKFFKKFFDRAKHVDDARARTTTKENHLVGQGDSCSSRALRALHALLHAVLCAQRRTAWRVDECMSKTLHFVSTNVHSLTAA
jgi:hypothetical protein